MSSDFWIVRLSAAADEDYRQILRWTVANFGKVQARSYANIVTSVLKELTSGPSIIGVKERSDIGMNIWTIHVARKGRKGRHFIVFRVNKMQGILAVCIRTGTIKTLMLNLSIPHLKPIQVDHLMVLLRNVMAVPIASAPPVKIHAHTTVVSRSG